MSDEAITLQKQIGMAELEQLLYTYATRICLIVRPVDSSDTPGAFLTASKYWGRTILGDFRPTSPGDTEDPPRLQLNLVAEFDLVGAPNTEIPVEITSLVVIDRGETRRFEVRRFSSGSNFRLRPESLSSDPARGDWVAAAMKTFTVAQLREMEDKGCIEESFTDCHPSLIDWWCHFGGVLKHKMWVGWYLLKIGAKLMWRALWHDLSKFHPSEARAFAFTSRRLRKTTYASYEYKDLLSLIKPTINLHYSRNRHHPDHYGKKPDGIHQMSAIDLIEMICDWRAAARRHDDGDPERSVQVNKDRFGYDDEMAAFFCKLIRV